MGSFKLVSPAVAKSPCARCLSSTRPARLPQSVMVTLPHEILSKIASHAVATDSILPATSFISAKPNWSTIAGLADASHELRDIAWRAWFRVLVLREESDWDVAAASPVVRLSVREIHVHSRALSPTTPPDALLSFPALRAAHINAHNDVSFDPRVGYTYYTLVPSIPRGLKRLAISHAHAPDGERLEAIVRASKTRDGIQLEELRLGRCTLFDCATEGCSYWPAFPHDHDVYFSDDGAVEYATSIAEDLAPLHTLRTLHLGVYLTPHVALSTHQHHHAPFTTPPPTPPHFAPAIQHHALALVNHHPPPAHHLHLLQHPNHRAPLHCPSLWASPCAACLEQFGPTTQAAEHEASSVLGELLPGLKEISWAGYFERYGRGVSVWQRGKEDWERGQK